MHVYADNASTTKISEKSVSAMYACMEQFYANPSSSHLAGQKALQKLDEARSKIATFLGCAPREVVFTSGGSEADSQALISAANIGAQQGKKHIISTKIEHHAVLNTLKHLEKQGFQVTLVDANPQGIITPEQILYALTMETCLVSVMYANNEIGTIQPIAEIAALCCKKGVLFHTDAVQAVGKLNINVRNEKIDLLSFSAHKFHGPKGVGALYCKKGIALSSIIYGGGQERGVRAGTENLPAIVGMATALEESLLQLDTRAAYISALKQQLLNGLLQIPFSFHNGDEKNSLAGIVNIGFGDVNSEMLLLLLDSKGICASYGSACSSGSLSPSHVLLNLGLSQEQAKSCIRFSLSAYNTKEDVDYIIKQTTALVAHLRKSKS